MVQEWKRDEQTNIGLPRRITSFFPGHSAFLLGETGLTTVERCFYSKKREKEGRGGGGRKEKRRASSRFDRDTAPSLPPRQTIVKTRHGGVEWWCAAGQLGKTREICRKY